MNIYNEHYNRWPEEPLDGSTSRRSQEYMHDPVLLGSTDGGQTWTLTTTAEFLDRAN